MGIGYWVMGIGYWVLGIGQRVLSVRIFPVSFYRVEEKKYGFKG